jgi:hypothetical protein
MLKKKIVASLIVLGSLLTFFVGTTLAYFVSASKPLINTFTVGKIQLELTETTGADYALVPGKTVEKDPKITVKAGSEACWLFVQLKKENHVDDYVSYQVADGWTALGGNGVYYRDVAKTQEDVAYTVLKDNQITIKDTVTEEKASLITSKPKLTVYAYAVQSDNVATAAEAWTIMQANLQE